MEKVIKKVPCQISKILFDEIKKAQETLNSIEHQKCMGKKKKKWTFIETSQKMGSFLKSLRNKEKNKSLIEIL